MVLEKTNGIYRSRQVVCAGTEKPGFARNAYLAAWTDIHVCEHGDAYAGLEIEVGEAAAACG